MIADSPTPSLSAGKLLLPAISLLALMLNAAIFGFFFAWSCSVMRGLDAADPRAAIEAMQAINAEVRNAVFAPAFFGTAPALALAALMAFGCRLQLAGALFAIACLVYLCGGLVVTIAVNVPLNEALAQIAAPENTEAARELWREYSLTWTGWNHLRTLFSGIALLLAGFALLAIRRR
jgi:uncharacterized membrane protein